MLMRRLLVVLTACFFTATAMTSFGFTSFKVHAHLLCVVIYSGACMSRTVSPGGRHLALSPIRESEVFRARLYRAKRLTDVLNHSFLSVQYALYLVIGTIINGKLIPLVFVARLTHHLLQMASNVYDHFTGRETSRFID
ncbi:hypothetical protein OSTOST_18740 [Ostertagia ostertagi]